MVHRAFSERLNQELDEMGLPEQDLERVEAFSKLIKTPKFQASSILHGEMLPSHALLKTIAEELEVSIEWLINGDASAKH